MTKKETSYEQALAELQGIVESIETGQINMDELEVQVRRASELLQYCKSKLEGTTTTLNQLFDQGKSA